MNASASTSPATRPSPIGLELWTVRTDLKRDLPGTLTAVAGLGYQAVEFFSSYLDWTTAYATETRALLDDLGLTCPSTHNGMRAFAPEAFDKTVELNRIIGSKAVVIASVPPIADLDGWRALAERLTTVAGQLRPHGLVTGLHNHQKEWSAVDGTRPIDLFATNTPADLVLQLDVGACVEAGADPVAFIHANPGRIRSVHCKDWSASRGYAVPFGEGDCPWADVVRAADAVGGVESYIIEQGHSTPEEEFEMARIGLANWRQLRASIT